jgi:hypothetical protein
VKTLTIDFNTAVQLGNKTDSADYAVLDHGDMKDDSSDANSTSTYRSVVFEHDKKCYQLDVCGMKQEETVNWFGFYNPLTSEWEKDPEAVLCAEVEKEERLITVWRPVGSPDLLV